MMLCIGVHCVPLTVSINLEIGGLVIIFNLLLYYIIYALHHACPHVGDRAYLEVYFQRSGRVLNETQIDVTGAHCNNGTGCLNGDCYVEHGLWQCM